MKTLTNVLENNKKWAEQIKSEDPTFFENLSKGQSPKILWIGCADSRVPAAQVTGLGPGDMFVHRNIANMVVHTDLNSLSVIQYAVEVLKVEHIVICGHYGCGGVKAALDSPKLGLIDNWLRNIKDVITANEKEIKELESNPEKQFSRLCELNVKHQVMNMSATTMVQDAWKNGQNLSVHGWIYNLEDGLLKDLDYTVTSQGDLTEAFRLNY